MSMRLPRYVLAVISCSLLIYEATGQLGQFSRSGSFLSFDPPTSCQDDTYDCYFKFGNAAATIDNRNISALFQIFPHFALYDQFKALLSPTQFTIELWVRIRDNRLLNGNSAQRPPIDRRIPLIGNLQAMENVGYELSCQRRISVVVCCLRLFLAVQPAASEVCVDVSSLVNDWFFFSGSLSPGGLIKVRAFSPILGSVPVTNTKTVSGSIRSALSVLNQGSLAMRIGMQVPFSDTGINLRGYAEFFTGDLDEIRIWRQNGFGDGLELETAKSELDFQKLLLYVPVLFRSFTNSSTAFNDQNSVVQDVGTRILGPSQFNSKPTAGTSQAGALAVTSAGLAWNISIGSTTTVACPTPPVLYVQPAWEQTCFVNYLDRRVEAFLSSASAPSISFDLPGIVAAATPTWRVNFAQFRPDDVAHLILRKPNWRDTITSSSSRQVMLINSVSLSVDSGLPFSQSQLTTSQINKIFQSVLPASAATVIAPNDIGSVLASELGCYNCISNAPCNCLQLKLTFASVGIAPTSSVPSSSVPDCSNIICPSGLRDQPSLRMLCLDWWVPRARGWSVRTAVAESSPLYQGLTGGRLEEEMQVLMGYEASPEWVGREEVPYVSAFSCATVSYLQDIGVSDSLFYVVVPGSEMVALLRARDRNLGDAVDILPLDDPGLPNGARLCPSLFYDSSDPQSTCNPQTLAPSSAYQTTACPPDITTDQRFATMPTYRGPLGLKPTCLVDGDRLFAVPQAKESAPRFWDRSLVFSPAPEQAGRLFSLRFVAASYPSLTCLGQDWQAGTSCGVPLTGSFPPAGGYPSNSEMSRTYRSMRILVPTSVVRFDPPTPAEGSEQLFVPGCSYSSTRLFVTGSADTAAAANVSANLIVRVGRYVFAVAPDPQQPPPPGVKLALVSTINAPDGSTSLQYTVTWAPDLALSAKGVMGCFVASDVGGVSSARRCFLFRRDKCRYCLGPQETLESIGRRYGGDWLQVPPNTLINVGVPYTVRPGDTLAGLAARFADSEDRIQQVNSDVDWGVGGVGLKAGALLCIVPRVCNAACLYGTDCYIY